MLDDIMAASDMSIGGGRSHKNTKPQTPHL